MASLPVSDFSVDVLRPEDFLALRFDFHNLEVDPKITPLELRRKRSGEAALVVVHFPVQSFGEQSFFESAPFPKPQPPQTPEPGTETLQNPAGVRASSGVDAERPGARWLVFQVADSVLPIPFTLPDLLLALSQCEQLVREAITPVILPPDPEDTAGGSAVPLVLRSIFSAIEAPYRLVLSPSPDTRWAHAGEPVSNQAGTRTELWHTRLSQRTATGGPDENSSAPLTARAVWSPDLRGGDSPLPPHDNVPFRMPLDRRDRAELVLLTAGTEIKGYTPLPVTLDHFMLSAFGAWLKARGAWLPPVLPEGFGKLTILEWRHLMTMGRDHFVKVVYAGFLFPLGHRASLVKITERRFDTFPAGQERTAFLHTRMFVLVREPVKAFTQRDFPWTAVELKTLVTPLIDDPGAGLDKQGQEAFWIKVAGSPFPFHVHASDAAGQTAELTMPLIFVSDNVNAKVVTMGHLGTAYHGLAKSDPLRARPLDGQAIAFAPPAQAGDTTFETSTVVFGVRTDAVTPAPDADLQIAAAFHPTFDSAAVSIPAVKHLLGSAAVSTVAWEPSFLATGGADFGNKSQVFLKVTGGPGLKFDIQKAGGLTTPNIAITGLSRSLGPIDIATYSLPPDPVTNAVVSGSLRDGFFAPTGIFPLDDLTILGCLKLKDLLAALNFTGAPDAQVPGLKTVRKGNVVETSYTWEVQKNGFRTWPGSDPFFEARSGAGMTLKTVLRQPLDGSSPSTTVTGSIRAFSVNLLPTFPLVKLDFDSIEFTSVDGRKPDVAVKFAGINYLGILEYAKALADALPMDGFDDPPYLDIILPPSDQAGINVGFSLGLPELSVGAFTLQNIALIAGFYLPFTKKPMNLHLAFCEREQPFILTVMAIGGGGFFGIDIGLKGVAMLEASLEFGACVAINLGVAAGSVSIMGGVYYQMAGDKFALSVYIRANGSLSVLGLINVSVEFIISLNYASKNSGQPHAGTLYGQAQLTVKIKILFFSKKVSITMERELAGSDPKFIDQYPEPEWQKYCHAFADYPPAA